MGAIDRLRLDGGVPPRVEQVRATVRPPESHSISFEKPTLEPVVGRPVCPVLGHCPPAGQIPDAFASAISPPPRLAVEFRADHPAAQDDVAISPSRPRGTTSAVPAATVRHADSEPLLRHRDLPRVRRAVHRGDVSWDRACNLYTHRVRTADSRACRHASAERGRSRSRQSGPTPDTRSAIREVGADARRTRTRSRRRRDHGTIRS
jgi:hypothetical protein